MEYEPITNEAREVGLPLVQASKTVHPNESLITQSAGKLINYEKSHHREGSALFNVNGSCCIAN